MASEFRKRLLSGLRWSSLATVVMSSLSFAVSVVLSRLLEPHVFGLVAMFIVARNLCEVVAAKPIGEALVYYRDADERDQSASFWLTTSVGAFLTVALVVGAPWIAAAFDEPALTSLVRFGAVACLLNGASVVPEALLRRELNFADHSKTRVVAALSGAVISIGGVLAGYGAYAIVLGELVQMVLELGSRLVMLRFKPLWVLWTPRMSGIVRYSSHLLVTGAFTFLGWQSDRAVLGRVFGAEQLGLYQRAFSMPHSITAPLMQVVESVLLPTLMQVQQDAPRLKNLSLRAVGVSAFVLAPAFVGLAAVAEPLVLTLFGPQWLDTVPLLEITAFTALAQVIGRPLMWLYRVGGRTVDLARWTIAAGSFYSGAVLVASFFGSVRGVAFAMLAVSVILLGPRVFFAGRIVGIRPFEVLRRLWGTAVATLLMLGSVSLAARAPGWLGMELPVIAQLIVQIACGGLTYLAAATALRLSALDEALSLIRSRRKTSPEEQPASG
jgi:O-antigen/teichoic acid export membrane protein